MGLIICIGQEIQCLPYAGFLKNDHLLTNITCHLSYVIWHVSHAMCHESINMCLGQSGGVSWWRVFYQQEPTHLVLIAFLRFTDIKLYSTFSEGDGLIVVICLRQHHYLRRNTAFKAINKETDFNSTIVNRRLK